MHHDEDTKQSAHFLDTGDRNSPDPLKTMVASVAHEVRNFLGSMELFSSLLSARLANDPEGAAMLEKIRFGIGGIERVVDDLLHYASQPKPRLEEAHLQKILADIGSFMAPLASSSGIAFVLDVPDELRVKGDHRMLSQAFLNLALNSVQAMPRGGTITVQARNEGEQVRVEFTDTGSGIPPEDIGRAFDPFFSTRENGTGLGLSIVHDIIAAHGGTITLTSRIGEGTIATIWLEGK